MHLVWWWCIRVIWLIHLWYNFVLNSLILKFVEHTFIHITKCSKWIGDSTLHEWWGYPQYCWMTVLMFYFWQAHLDFSLLAPSLQPVSSNASGPVADTTRKSELDSIISQMSNLFGLTMLFLCKGCKGKDERGRTHFVPLLDPARQGISSTWQCGVKTSVRGEWWLCTFHHMLM